MQVKFVLLETSWPVLTFNILCRLTPLQLRGKYATRILTPFSPDNPGHDPDLYCIVAVTKYTDILDDP